MIDPVEVAGFVLSLAMIYCNIKEIHWGWPLAMLSAILYFAVFWQSHLYGQAGLQIMFLVLSAWGWWQWLKTDISAEPSLTPQTHSAPTLEQSEGHATQLAISSLQTPQWWPLMVITLMCWAACSYVLMRYTDSEVAIWDALVTALSLTGQYLLARKKIENWWVWLAVNFLAVGLMLSQSLWLTSLLYALFGIMSYAGLRTWQKKYVP
jgi:nicotinamide mononucleotide transporter